MDDDCVLRAVGLTRRYGDFTAVDGLDLSIRRGEIYGFLGLNGAGKTTTIRMLLGLIRPSAGSITLLGEPLRPGSARFSRVGCLVETATAWPNLTVEENLDIQRRLTGAPAGSVNRVIEELKLDEYRRRRFDRLSLGNRQRLALARALINQPDLLILDEPANALDPAGIIEIRQLLWTLARERGTTIFMSSHILTEIDQLADRIGIIHKGRLLDELDRSALAAASQTWVEATVSDPARACSTLKASAGLPGQETPVIESDAASGLLRLRLAPDADRVACSAWVARILVGAGIDLHSLTTRRENLESRFMRLTGGTV